MEAAVIPLPSPESTPPVTNIYLVGFLTTCLLTPYITNDTTLLDCPRASKKLIYLDNQLLIVTADLYCFLYRRPFFQSFGLAQFPLYQYFYRWVCTNEQ